MKADRLTRIRERAYAIWEAEGRPHGRDVEHWARAANEIDAEDRQAAAGSGTERTRRGKAARRPKPAAAAEPAEQSKRPLVGKLTSAATSAVRAVTARKAKTKKRGGPAVEATLATAADKPSTGSPEES